MTEVQIYYCAQECKERLIEFVNQYAEWIKHGEGHIMKHPLLPDFYKIIQRHSKQNAL